MREHGAAPEKFVHTDYYLLPEVTMPEWTEHEDGSSLCVKPETSLHPFWCIRRITASTLAYENSLLMKHNRPEISANCELCDIDASNVVHGLFSNTRIDGYAGCTLKTVCNTVNIRRGQELLIQIPERDTAAATADQPQSKKRKVA